MRMKSIGSASTLCMAFLIVSSCTTQQSQPPDTSSHSAAVASAASPPNGTLPPGWDSKNSEEMRAFINAVTWTSPTPGKRSCAYPKQCNGGTVEATISANTDAQLITPQNSGTGALIARMVLNGPDQDAMYKLIPGAFKYYVVVSPATSGSGMDWRLVQVADIGKSPIRVIGSGPFRSCGHQDSVRKETSANWAGCNSLIKNASYRLPLATLQDTSGDGGGDRPGWISCAEGCCTVSLAQLAFRNAAIGMIASANSSHSERR